MGAQKWPRFALSGSIEDRPVQANYSTPQKNEQEVPVPSWTALEDLEALSEANPR